MTGAVTHRLRGGVDILGVRSRPGGAAVLLNLPADELSGRTVALADDWPHRAHLIERAAESSSPGERMGPAVAETQPIGGAFLYIEVDDLDAVDGAL